MIESAFLRHDPNEEAARASAARATPHDAVTAAETTTRRQWGSGVSIVAVPTIAQFSCFITSRHHRRYFGFKSALIENLFLLLFVNGELVGGLDTVKELKENGGRSRRQTH